MKGTKCAADRTTRVALGRIASLGIVAVTLGQGADVSASILQSEGAHGYIDGFIREDEELYGQHIPNAQAWEFLRNNIPLFECPDADIERTYYFRWWTYRKHIKETPDGLFWQIDDRDGMEVSVGGSGKRPTINSYLYGDAVAIASIARRVGRTDLEKEFREKANRLKSLVQAKLWDPGKGGIERGKDYNHSTYCDLIISGLIGLRPRADDWVQVNPLVPPDTWDWFCLDNVLYHGRTLTIFWDKTGERYGRGAGLRVLADGREIARAKSISRVEGRLPSSSSGTAAGWQKASENPVLGGDLGTCFDVTLLKEAERYRMWFSWRPKKSVALVESRDGIHWSQPHIVLGPNPDTDWENDLNRPSVLKRDDGYHLWYTGQARGRSWIGYATSPDGASWTRRSSRPVLSAEAPWEKVAVMCPHVVWDARQGIFRMWYSAGEQYEPNAIGYATSPDGLRWHKHGANPVFVADPHNPWEQHKVTACQVIPRGEWYLMFYIGFRNEDLAQIGLARSLDGITGWQRHPANPIIFPDGDHWDGDACYKPFAIFDPDQNRWLLWYNGRKGGVEQIGLALHPGANLGFPRP